MLMSMTTRRSIHQFVEEECVRGPDVASPTLAFCEALQRWAPGAGHMIPTSRFIKKVLAEDYGITATGSRHTWFFPGLEIKPMLCHHCKRTVDREDRTSATRHWKGVCDA